MREDEIMAKFTWDRPTMAARARRKSLLRGGSMSYKQKQSGKAIKLFSGRKKKLSIFSGVRMPKVRSEAFSSTNNSQGANQISKRGKILIPILIFATAAIIVVVLIAIDQSKITPEQRRSRQAAQENCRKLAEIIDKCRAEGRFPCGSKCDE
jgi:hypothetical protein